ncbi:MAG: hypothetical protein K0B52_03655 [FCB group bacterium]|nr:hypothetical protein [FCB group bacterium]
MKINLLREDQMTKVPHQDKEKEVLRFDDTFTGGGGNDDFYFQPPSPPTDEYKKPPRKFRVWLFILLLLLFLLGGAFISNPTGTRDFFKDLGNNIVLIWNKGIQKVKTWRLPRVEKDMSYVPERPEPKEVREIPKEIPKPEVKKEVAAPKSPAKAPEPPTIVVEKRIEKEIVKETTEEKILESPPIYERIRDELALSIRNMQAAEAVWSKVPGGMIMDRLNISEDRLSVSVMSRNPMLIQLYANVIEQQDMFTSFVLGEPEKIDEFTRIQLTSNLSPFNKQNRPARIWDLDVEWFDDYLEIAAKQADVQIIMEKTGSRKLDSGILQHDLKLKISGTRTAVSLVFPELRNIPAAFFVREIASSYSSRDESNILEMTLVYYERE